MNTGQHGHGTRTYSSGGGNGAKAAGRRLAEIRRDKGRVIRDLADHLGLDRGTIHRLEHGYYLNHALAGWKYTRLRRFYGPRVDLVVSEITDRHTATAEG